MALRTPLVSAGQTVSHLLYRSMTSFCIPERVISDAEEGGMSKMLDLHFEVFIRHPHVSTPRVTVANQVEVA